MSNIYTYIEDNFNIEVDSYVFKRDYIQNPLKCISLQTRQRENPIKEDLEYLYLTLNLNKKDVEKILSVSETSLNRFLKVYNIEKSNDLINDSRRNTKLRLYGNDKFNNRNKAKQTCLKKFGVENPSQLDEIKQKKVKTCKEHFNVEYPMQSKEIMNKSFETCEKIYGYHRASESMEIKEKIWKTNIKKYGSKCTLNNPNIKSKAEKTYMEHGTDYISKEEQSLIAMIRNKGYSIKTQYRSDKRYPFKCDVYIEDLDIFVEYQGSWVHGPNKYDCHEPYDSMNPKHIKAVKLMKENISSNYYKRAIQTWTVKDPLKRQTAKNNGITLLEFFEYDKMKEWIESLPNKI